MHYGSHKVRHQKVRLAKSSKRRGVGVHDPLLSLVR
jgi:hypothetical protein